MNGNLKKLYLHSFLQMYFLHLNLKFVITINKTSKT